jgi:hypothetical protein
LVDSQGLEALRRDFPDLLGFEKLELLLESELESSDGSDSEGFDLTGLARVDPRRALSKKFSAATRPGVRPREGKGVAIAGILRALGTTLPS